MSADWKAGDRALRITHVDLKQSEIDGWISPPVLPIKGTIYLVSYVTTDSFMDGAHQGLHLVGIYDQVWKETGAPFGWNPTNFRKIVPACDREEIEQEQERNNEIRFQ